MGNVTMYDSVNVDGIPSNAQMVAAYINGIYANVSPMLVRFPKTPILTISVTGTGVAQVLDVETGDATVGQIDGWLKSYALSGPVFTRPTIYMNLSTAQTNFPTHPKGCNLWTAHYTGVAHFCDEGCGLNYTADLTQWRSTTTFDESIVNSAILRGSTKVATQANWRWCNKCKGLYYGPDEAESVCPKGGTHTPGESFNYELTYNG